MSSNPPEAAAALLVPIPAVAEMLGISRTLTYSLINRGAIKSVRLGGARRVVLASLHDYIANQIEGQAA